MITGFFDGGELGIRTLGTFLYTTFRVSHLRPLGQLSVYLLNCSFLVQKRFGENYRREQEKIFDFNVLKPRQIKGFVRTKPPKLRRISSQPRYDHFDTSPSMLNPVLEYNDYSIFIERGAPLCPARVPEIFRSLFASQNFDRGHSFLLPSSATVTRTPKTHFVRFEDPLGGGRKRPHFDISPY